MTVCVDEPDALAPDIAEPSATRRPMPGWRQDLLAAARVLVAGSGTLGNEVLKTLALLGIGTVGIVDFDRVEEVNLGSSVLFRAKHIGTGKASAAAASVRELAPASHVISLDRNIVTELGAGFLAGYDLVLGCTDNIEARWRLNRLCHAGGVPWIDGGIEDSAGQIAFFDGAEGACYECSMTASMWDRLQQRRSCTGARAQPDRRPEPVNAVIASVIGAMQVQEAVAQLHARAGFRFRTLASGEKVHVSLAPYQLTVLRGKRFENCLAHAETAAFLTLTADPESLTAEELLRVTGTEALELEWDVAGSLLCEVCDAEAGCWPAFRLTAELLTCPCCGTLRTPRWTHRVQPGDALAHQTLARLGVPPRAFLSLALRGGSEVVCRLEDPRA